jgi:hypothetical protein
MKRHLLLFLCVFFTFFVSASWADTSIFPTNTPALSACPIVPSYTDPTFCTEFKTTVICNCHAHFTNKKMWPIFCGSVTSVYTGMMGLYHSILRACISQYGANDPTDITECRNQWHCAMQGKSVSGGACSGNPVPTQACPNIS